MKTISETRLQKHWKLNFALAALALLPFVLCRVAGGQTAGVQAANGQTTYKLTDLGTLGGTFGVAGNIANSGAAVGGATLPGDTAIRATLWPQGATIGTDLGSLPGGPNSFGNVINELSQVVGLADSSSSPHDANAFYCPSSVNCHSFLWENGVMTDLGTLPGGNSSQANWINNKGQIVGVSQVAALDPNTPGAQQDRAYLLENGVMTDLGTLGGFDAFADGINDAGEIAGSSDVSTTIDPAVGFVPHHGFLIIGGVMTDLGTLGGEFSFAFVANGRSEVIGGSTLAGEQHMHGFLWQNGVMTDLGTVSGDTDSLAFGINDFGQIVGGSANSSTGAVRAFLWQNGVMTDLNTLIPATSGFTLLIAFWTNARGEIVGCALQQSTGEVHAFLLTPVNNGSRGRAGGAPLPASVRKLLLRRAELSHTKFLTSGQ